MRDIRTNERNGPVVGVLSVRDSDDIMLITVQGMVNRTHASEVRITGRNTQGVRVMNLRDEDLVSAVALVVDTGDESPGETAPSNGAES